MTEKKAFIQGFLREPLEDPFVDHLLHPIVTEEEFLREDPTRMLVPEQPLPNESAAVEEFLRQHYPPPCEDTELFCCPSWVSFTISVSAIQSGKDVDAVPLCVLKMPAVARAVDRQTLARAARCHGKVLTNHLPGPSLIDVDCITRTDKQPSELRWYEKYWVIYDPQKAARKREQRERRRRKREEAPPSLVEALRGLDMGIAGCASAVLGSPPWAYGSSWSLGAVMGRLLNTIQTIFLAHMERSIFFDDAVWKFFHTDWPRLRPSYFAQVARARRVDEFTALGLWEGLKRLEKLCPKRQPKNFRRPPKSVRERLLTEASPSDYVSRSWVYRLQVLQLAGHVEGVDVVMAEDCETKKLFRGGTQKLDSVDTVSIVVGQPPVCLRWDQIYSVRAVCTKESWSWANHRLNLE